MNEDPLAEQDDVQDPLAHDLKSIFIDLGEAIRVETQWVIRDLLPVGLTIIGAPPKEGKSAFAMVMAALVAGLKPKVLPPDLCEVPETGTVLCFSYEAGAGELKTMMEDGIHVKIPADGRILVVEDPWSWRLDDDGSRELLMQTLSEETPRLVIMDTFRDMHDMEEKDSGAMVRMLKPIRQWAVENDSAIVLVHHTVKVSDEVAEFDAKHLRGSGAIFGKADGVIMLTRKRDGKHYMKAIFKRAKGWERTLQLALYDVTESGEPLTELDVLVFNGLKEKATLQEIAEALHIGKQAVVACCSKLARNEYIKKEGNTWLVTKKEIVR